MDAHRRRFLRGLWDPSYLDDSAASNGDLEIVSLIVHTRPQHLAAVSEMVSGVAGAEIHASDPMGKLVVVLEADSQAQAGSRMIQINNLPHVLSVAMVFQATDSSPVA